MNERDRWDELAERLLPCRCYGLPEIPSWLLEAGHKPICPACHRPAVAAELRKLAKEHDEVEDNWFHAAKGMERKIGEQRQRIEKLEAALNDKPYREDLLRGDKKDTCVYLKNGEKIVVQRYDQRCWLEILPQDTIVARGALEE